MGGIKVGSGASLDGAAAAKAAAARAAAEARAKAAEAARAAAAAKQKLVGAGASLAASADTFTPRAPLQIDAQKVLDAGKRVLADPIGTVKDVANTTWNVITNEAQQKVEELKQGVTDKLDAFNVKKNLDQLKPGDTYKMEFELSGAAEGYKLGEKVNIEYTKRAKLNPDGSPAQNPDGTPKYEFVMSVGGGVNGGVGTSSKSATLGADVKVEFVCDTQEELDRCLQCMDKAGAPSRCMVSAHNPGPLTPEDAEFLQKHTAAYEITGSGAAQVSKSLGLKIGKTDEEGLLNAGGGSANANVGLTVRIERDPATGNFTSATVKEAVTVEGEANVGLSFSKEGTLIPTGSGQAGNKQLKVGVSVTAESKVTLAPPGLNPDELYADPMGTAQKTKVLTIDNSVTVEVSENRGNNGHKATLKISGKSEDIYNRKTLEKIAQGDVLGGLKDLGDKVQVEAQVSGQQRHGINAGLGIEVVDVKVVAERTENTVLIEKKGTGTEVVRALADGASKVRPEDIQAQVELTRRSVPRAA